MHELSIARALIDSIHRHLPEAEKSQVLTIKLAVGQLAGVDEQALRLAFELASSNTVLAGAALDIETVAAEAHCPNCAVMHKVNSYFDACPACGQENLTITEGEGLALKSIEVA